MSEGQRNLSLKDMESYLRDVVDELKDFPEDYAVLRKSSNLYAFETITKDIVSSVRHYLWRLKVEEGILTEVEFHIDDDLLFPIEEIVINFEDRITVTIELKNNLMFAMFRNYFITGTGSEKNRMANSYIRYWKRVLLSIFIDADLDCTKYEKRLLEVL